MLSLFRRNFIFQAVQDLANSIEKEILNSDKFREPQRVTFQNDMKKSPLHFPLYKKGGLYCLCLYCFAPHPNHLPKKGRGNTLRHRITAAAKFFFQEFLNYDQINSHNIGSRSQ